MFVWQAQQVMTRQVIALMFVLVALVWMHSGPLVLVQGEMLCDILLKSSKPVQAVAPNGSTLYLIINEHLYSLPFTKEFIDSQSIKLSGSQFKLHGHWRSAPWLKPAASVIAANQPLIEMNLFRKFDPEVNRSQTLAQVVFWTKNGPINFMRDLVQDDYTDGLYHVLLDTITGERLRFNGYYIYWDRPWYYFGFGTPTRYVIPQNLGNIKLPYTLLGTGEVAGDKYKLIYERKGMVKFHVKFCEDTDTTMPTMITFPVSYFKIPKGTSCRYLLVIPGPPGSSEATVYFSSSKSGGYSPIIDVEPPAFGFLLDGWFHLWDFSTRRALLFPQMKESSRVVVRYIPMRDYFVCGNTEADSSDASSGVTPSPGAPPAWAADDARYSSGFSRNKKWWLIGGGILLVIVVVLAVSGVWFLKKRGRGASGTKQGALKQTVSGQKSQGGQPSLPSGSITEGPSGKLQKQPKQNRKSSTNSSPSKTAASTNSTGQKLQQKPKQMRKQKKNPKKSKM